MYQTNMYEGMLAETITMNGHTGDAINAYFARPLGSGPFPGVVLIHHLPGWTSGTGRPRGGSRTTVSRPFRPISITAKVTETRKTLAPGSGPTVVSPMTRQSVTS